MFLYTIKLSHFNSNYLNKLLNNIIILFNLFLNFNSIVVVNLPNKRHFNTILRSPHIFKKSREQFSMVIYNKLIILKCKKDYINILKFFLSSLNCNYTLKICYER